MSRSVRADSNWKRGRAHARPSPVPFSSPFCEPAPLSVSHAITSAHRLRPSELVVIVFISRVVFFVAVVLDYLVAESASEHAVTY